MEAHSIWPLTKEMSQGISVLYGIFGDEEQATNIV